MVNFFGTFITTGELPIDDPVRLEGFIGLEHGNVHTGDRYIPFADIVQAEIEKMAA